MRKNHIPDIAPVPFSSDDGEGEIAVGAWSEGVGFRIQAADGSTLIIRLGQHEAIGLANKIMYAVDIEDDRLPVLDAVSSGRS